MICYLNKWTGFYLIGTSVMTELTESWICFCGIEYATAACYLLCYYFNNENQSVFYKKCTVAISAIFFSKNRSSHLRYSVRKGVLKNFAKFTGEHLCQSLFFDKVAGLWGIFFIEHLWETASEQVKLMLSAH